MENVTASTQVLRYKVGFCIFIYAAFTTIPPLLLRMGAISVEYKFSVLASLFCIATVSAILCVLKGTCSLEELGFTKDFKGYRHYLICAFLGSMMVLSYGYIRYGGFAVDIDTLAWYSAAGSFMQTFLYQSVLYRLGQEIWPKKPVLNVSVNVLVFSLMHYLIYPTNYDLAVWIIPGAATFSILYWKYPNAYLAFGIHAAYNAAAVFAGVIH